MPDHSPTSAPARRANIDALVLWDSVGTGLRMLNAIMVAQALAGVVLYFVVREFVPQSKLNVWLVVHFGAIVATFISEKWRQRSPLTIENAAAAGNFLVGFALVRSLSWMLGALLFFPYLPFGVRAVFLALICVMAVGAVSTSVAYYRVFVVFMFGALIPVTLMFAFSVETPARALGIGMLFGCIMILQAGRRLSRWLIEASRRKFELERISEDLRRERSEAEAAREAAEHASADKTRFLASASHDLRQPMHSLGLFLEAAREKNSDLQVGELLSKVNHSVRALDALFESLLDISRLDGANVQPKRVRFALAPMLADIEHRFAGVARESGLSLRIRTTARWALSDPALLDRIISNLVANALRYTERGGVLVGVRSESERLRIEVWDTGVGIPSEKHKAIFDEFVQLSNPERDRRKGLGLGLAIVRRLCALLGHAVQLKSRVGRGTVFTVLVPAARAMSTAQPLGRASVEMTDDHQTESVAFRAHVLLIDDESTALDATRMALEILGCKVTPAANAERALAQLKAMLLKDICPDVIVSDYRLGSDADNGLELINQLRACAQQEIPAVLVTGDAGMLDAFAQPNRLPNHVSILSKPASSQELIRAVMRLAGAGK
jgi:two-component system, sensor histidine kinase